MTDAKPLFHPDALRPGLAALTLPPAAVAARGKLADWAKMLGSGAADRKKETELLPGFVSDVFEGALGYTRPPAAPYTLKREALIQVDGKFADAGLGRFGAGPDAFAAVLEGKGPKDPLDRPFAGRKRSAVEQAMLYAVQLRVDWYLVTNLRETRLYCKRQDTAHYERFDTARLAADDAEFRRFVFLLGADRVAPAAGPNHLDALLADSRRIGRELTADYYAEYRDLRRRTFAAVREHNPGRDPRELLAATQKVLDRVLFVAFCEDRGLLPAEIVARAYTHADPFRPRPVWDNFKGLFEAVDRGRDALSIPGYNGGLFARDPAVDSLTVPDDVCAGFKRLADYEYGPTAGPDRKVIDVEILGHIFEQSISDLEEMQRELAAAPAGPSKRKREGAFYTPAFVTRYLVAETLGPVLAERFEALRARHEAAAPKSGKGARAGAALKDPRVFEKAKLAETQGDALVRFWNDRLADLETVRVVDPSCGSGAFLIEAFDQLFAAYTEAQGFLTELTGGPGLLDVQRSILTHNLFGMDLNGEAVGVARLACWIKTAERGKKLTALDANIVQGNSVVADPSPAEAWRRRFPDAAAAGGFDVAVGNPPYVRQEWIAADKPFLQRHYRAYDGAADLYVYFYELGLTLLRPGGRLGYVVTNKWMRAGYGGPLRRLLGAEAWVESVVDLGHNKEVFPDADVFPCVLTARKPDGGPAPEAARVCVLPREQTRVDDLSEQIRAAGVAVPRARFGADPWTLDPPAVAALLDKLKRTGVPLKEFIGGVPYRGIMTGFNEAFLIDTAAKDRLVAADPSSAPLFRPYLRGQDVDRWRAGWSGLWMVALKSSANRDWPWAKAGDEAAAEAVFARTHPALHAHMFGHRAELTARTDKGQFWWELRACAYWDKFDAPKVIYQEIQFHPSYTLDAAGMLANNKVFFLPTADRYLLGVLNSSLMWWHNWRYLPHMKDEALSPAGFLMECLPIPRPTDAQREEVERLVSRLIDLKGGSTDGLRALLDWLQSEMGAGKVSQRLSNLVDLTADELVAEVKKLRAKRTGLGVADLKRLREEYAASVVPLQALAREAGELERRVSAVVDAAFGLTADEVKLVWDTAPPRMPTPRPPGV
jgi:hypothetical protein